MTKTDILIEKPCHDLAGETKNSNTFPQWAFIYFNDEMSKFLL